MYIHVFCLSICKVTHRHAVFLRVASPPCQTVPIQLGSGKIQHGQMEMLPSKVAPVRRAQLPDTALQYSVL